MPQEGFEPSHLSIVDFESTASTFPPPGQLFGSQDSTRSYTFFLMREALFLLRYLTINLWSKRWDSNPRFYSFADCCVGPLRHAYIDLAPQEGFEPPSDTLEECCLVQLDHCGIRNSWCLWRDSNPHTPHYLYGALARYKLASLTN